MAVAFLALGTNSFVAADDAEKWQRADDIDHVTWSMEISEPPNLSIFVTGRFAKEGLFFGKLPQAEYDVPPKDGVQDFYLMIQPEKGFKVPDELKSKNNVHASAFWKHCTADAPWLRGIRVHSANGTALKSIATR